MGALTVKDHQSGNLAKYQSDRRFAVRTLGRFFDELVKLIALVEPSYVLNLGCGEGLDMKNIKQRAGAGFAYGCGLDLNVEALKMVDRSPGSRQFDLVQGDLHHLPFKFDTFDMILCLEVLEHLDQPERALGELSRRFTGHYLFSVPNEPYYRLTRLLLFRRDIRRLGDHPEHVNHWSTRGFTRLIERYFTVDKVVAPFPWTAVLCQNERRRQD